MSYGKELIIDLFECDVSRFNRKSIKKWLIELCELIGMNREDLHFWDYAGQRELEKKAPLHLQGTSAIQFITTSNITTHSLSGLGECYINLFSCKEFSEEKAVNFTREFFGAKDFDWNVFERGKKSKHEMEKLN